MQGLHPKTEREGRELEAHHDEGEFAPAVRPHPGVAVPAHQVVENDGILAGSSRVDDSLLEEAPKPPPT